MTKKKKSKKWLWVLLGLTFLTMVLGGFFAYMLFLYPNVNEDQEYIYIKTDSDFATLYSDLREDQVLKYPFLFDIASHLMSYRDNVKPGRYSLKGIENNRQLIQKLRGGYQDAVKFRFQNVRLKETFAGLLGANFEADSTDFSQLLNDKTIADKYGFTEDNFFVMFIPNTYEIYWNTPPEKIIERFSTEYKTFWNEERLNKAKALGLTPEEVGILASIVKGEALHTDEMAKIAGLYLNRLERGILLQADPTVIFANNDFTIRRVLNKHLRFDSPYNTYIYKGLPPGPIMMPSIASIDAVLNPEKHSYIYMCAKDDFSGYHNFATNIAEHQVNARKFQRALDERNIKK